MFTNDKSTDSTHIFLSYFTLAQQHALEGSSLDPWVPRPVSIIKGIFHPNLGIHSPPDFEWQLDSNRKSNQSGMHLDESARVIFKGKGWAHCVDFKRKEHTFEHGSNAFVWERGSNVKITCCCLEMLKFNLKYPPWMWIISLPGILTLW